MGWRQPSSDMLTPTSASSVVVNDRELVQISLRGDASASEACPQYDLFVNPESMLIERIDGQEPLADGWARTTRLDITPIFVRDQTTIRGSAGQAAEVAAREVGDVDNVDEADAAETTEAFGIDESISLDRGLDRDVDRSEDGDDGQREARSTSEQPSRGSQASPPPNAGMGSLDPLLSDPPVLLPPMS